MKYSLVGGKLVQHTVCHRGWVVMYSEPVTVWEVLSRWGRCDFPFPKGGKINQR